MANKEYDYDTAATTTIVYDSSTIFTNAKSSLCPLHSCTLTKSDCETALADSFYTLLTIDADDPFSLRISQTWSAGYSNTAFCYSCKTKDSVSGLVVQTLTN